MNINTNQATVECKKLPKNNVYFSKKQLTDEEILNLLGFEFCTKIEQSEHFSYVRGVGMVFKYYKYEVLF